VISHHPAQVLFETVAPWAIGSEDTAIIIDSEIKGIITSCLNNATRLLLDNKEKLTALTENLVTRETLDGEDVRALLGLIEINN